ncbi:hypothetical protein NHX12_004777, partial [Muraenolepis orangiensis]
MQEEPVHVLRCHGDRGSAHHAPPPPAASSGWRLVPRGAESAQLRSFGGVELDNMAGDEMFYSKKRTWESNKNDIRVCRMKGKHEEECRNYIKVLLSHHDGLFVCGTNAFNPLCANYTRDSLEMTGESTCQRGRVR